MHHATVCSSAFEVRWLTPSPRERRINRKPVREAEHIDISPKDQNLCEYVLLILILERRRLTVCEGAWTYIRTNISITQKSCCHLLAFVPSPGPGAVGQRTTREGRRGRDEGAARGDGCRAQCLHPPAHPSLAVSLPEPDRLARPPRAAARRPPPRGRGELCVGAGFADARADGGGERREASRAGG